MKRTSDRGRCASEEQIAKFHQAVEDADLFENAHRDADGFEPVPA